MIAFSRYVLFPIAAFVLLCAYVVFMARAVWEKFVIDWNKFHHPR